MIDTPYIIAAFAALFLISGKSRLPSFLCIIISLVNYNNESLLFTDNFIWYSINSTALNLTAAFIMLSRPITKRVEAYALLFAVTALVDLTGGLCSNYYLDTRLCNLTGLYVIMTQLMLLWSDRNGGLTNSIVGAFVSIRYRLFI